jgi:hypothetical protein
MAERRMADVVGQAQSFGQILVETKGACQSPADLSHLQAMSEPNPEMIAIWSDEDLGLVTKPSERNGMDDPVAVSLKGVARPPIILSPFGMPAAKGAGRIAGIRG